jgi:predicted DNA-binding transcriptional regulator AlpA
MRQNSRGQEQLGLWDPGAEHQNAAERPSRTARPARSAPTLPARRPARPMEYQELWDIDDLSNYLGVPKQTIYSWRTTGYGPKGMRIGKHLRWWAATVITWTLGLEETP